VVELVRQVGLADKVGLVEKVVIPVQRMIEIYVRLPAKVRKGLVEKEGMAGKEEMVVTVLLSPSGIPGSILAQISNRLLFMERLVHQEPVALAVPVQVRIWGLAIPVVRVVRVQPLMLLSGRNLRSPDETIC
jgi:hypothetical protein